MPDRPSTSQTNGSDLLLLNESRITTIVRRIYDSVKSISRPQDERPKDAIPLHPSWNYIIFKRMDI